MTIGIRAKWSNAVLKTESYAGGPARFSIFCVLSLHLPIGDQWSWLEVRASLEAPVSGYNYIVK